MLVGRKQGQEDGLQSWRPRGITEGKAARLGVAVRKQERKKICFSFYGNTVYSVQLMLQRASRGRLGDAEKGWRATSYSYVQEKQIYNTVPKMVCFKF